VLLLYFHRQCTTDQQVNKQLFNGLAFVRDAVSQMLGKDLKETGQEIYSVENLGRTVEAPDEQLK